MTSTRSYELRRATSSWTESTTWTTQPSVAATATSTVSIPALTGSGTTIQWLAGSDVQAYIAGSASNLAWRLQDTAEDGGIVPVSITFGSREAASNRPQLVITYRP